MKFAIFCTPYYLRHCIEIFSDCLSPLDVTVLFWKFKKDTRMPSILIFKVSHSNRKSQQSFNVYRHKMDESGSFEFGLLFSDKIKCIQQFKHVLLMNFKNLEKCDILKMRKKSTLIKISSVWCFLKLDRPVYYRRFLNLINATLLIIYSPKKSIFAFLPKKLRIER